MNWKFYHELLNNNQDNLRTTKCFIDVCVCSKKRKGLTTMKLLNGREAVLSISDVAG